MQINWFTVIAQVINFLVLVWMLKRFLYKPISDAIDKREKKISSELAKAEDIKTQATKEKEEFQQRNRDFDQKKKKLMDNAVEAVEIERKKRLQQVTVDTENFRKKQQKVWDDSQEKLSKQFVIKTRKIVLDISKKTLNELASVGLEQQTFVVFLSQLKELDSEGKNEFKKHFKIDSEPVLVRSAFELTPAQESDIKKAVGEILSANPAFQFEVSPQLICGIELTSNGYQLAWSIEAYLDTIQKNVDLLVNNSLVTDSKKIEHAK